MMKTCSSGEAVSICFVAGFAGARFFELSSQGHDCLGVRDEEGDVTTDKSDVKRVEAQHQPSFAILATRVFYHSPITWLSPGCHRVITGGLTTPVIPSNLAAGVMGRAAGSKGMELDRI
jgi:hypothetical protein